MAVNPPSSTTGGNTLRVGTYSGVAVSITALLKQYLGMDDATAGAVIIVAAAAITFIWNLAKDQGWIKDNR